MAMMSCESSHTKATQTMMTELAAAKRRLMDRQKELNAAIGCARRDGEDAAALIAENRALSAQLKHIEAQLAVPEAEHTDTGPADVKVLTTTEEFGELRDEWATLLSRSEVFSPFMMWEWLFSWWEYYGGNKQLRIFTLRDESDKLIGLAPLMIGFQGKRFEPRTLAFIGSGQEGPRGQCFQVVVDPVAQGSVSSDLWASIRQTEDEWDIWRMWKVMGEVAAWDLVASAVQEPNHEALVEFESKAVCGPLHNSFEEFLAAVPGSTQRNLLRNQYTKLTEKYSSVQFQVCRTRDELEQAAITIMDFSIARQRGLGNTSSWLEPSKRECLLKALHRLFEVGGVQVSYLSLEDRIVAGVIGLVRNGRLFIFAPSFDVRFGQQQVMHALYGCLISEAMSAGIAELDWLSDHPYQRQFVRGERSLLSIRICSNNVGSERAARQMWLRRLRRRLMHQLRLSTVPGRGR